MVHVNAHAAVFLFDMEQFKVQRDHTMGRCQAEVLLCLSVFHRVATMLPCIYSVRGMKEGAVIVIAKGHPRARQRRLCSAPLSPQPEVIKPIN